ncbi:redoxin domain-containing protein [Flavobacterium sp. LaA7.5]|nr:redoxin domain-containing protein [Flavobacterium salilacus subsp. altitudinum]
MQNFTTALKAEHIKKKGTGLYVVAGILGAISPLIWTIVTIIQDTPNQNKLPYNYFTEFIENCLDPFSTFFFPLMIIITVSRITQLDHKNGGWQLMETQPVKKSSIYFSKFSVILIANLISIFSLIGGCFLFGYIASLIIEVPENASLSFEIGSVLLIAARLFIAGLFFTALQYIISVLLPSFIWSILIGFFLLLAYLFLTAFKVVPDWYPIELLGKIATYKKGSDLGYWFTYSAAVSCICAIIALYIGFEWYKHKKIKLAFGTGKRAAMLVAVLIVFGGLLYYTLTPRVMEPHNRTVIAGIIDSDMPIDKIYIRDIFISDTIAEITVKDNKFHYAFTKNMPLDTYELALGSIGSITLTMATNDSTFLDFKKRKQSTDIALTGTRLAENLYKKDNQLGWSSVNYYIRENVYLDKPDFITKELVSGWEEAMAESDKFKTVDNYVPRDDFKQKNKKLLTLNYLNMWNDFLKKRAALYPNEETKETPAIAEMKKVVALNDEGLLSNADYFNYVSSQITADDTEDVSQNTKSLRAIAKLEPGSFKDKMLFKQLKKSMEEASDKKERDSLAVLYADNFSNKRYTDIILYRKQIIEKLAKGKQAPLFDAITINNKPVNLADLRGKYVAIDVWATWCAPCKYQSPYFEKFAVKYKNENIQFVAVSTDDKMDDWYVEAKSKSKSVLQLHINNKNEFSKNYNVTGIPRFILIDPEGNLVNAEMPFPDDQTFEQLLRQALGLEEQK